MKETVKLKALKRQTSGTGPSRLSRGKKMIPGIIYGEKKDPIPITVNEKELKMEVQDTGFFSKQCEIILDKETLKVLPKDIQLHPVKENILHIDFLRVGENTTVTLYVPVKFINENGCEGLKQGGVINIVRHEVELKTPVSKIPEFLEASAIICSTKFKSGCINWVNSRPIDLDVSVILLTPIPLSSKFLINFV